MRRLAAGYVTRKREKDTPWTAKSSTESKSFWLSHNPRTSTKRQLQPAQASRLMREHDIAESMLDTSDEPQPLQLGEEVIEDGARLATWKANIASGIAAANGCHLFTKRSGDKTALTMFGKPNAIATSRYMFAYLVATVERLAHASGGVSTKWRNGFKLGCAHTIYTRLLADKREHEAQVKQSGASASAALVRVQTDADRIKAAFNARTAGFSKGRKATSRVTMAPTQRAAMPAALSTYQRAALPLAHPQSASEPER
jgi:hypothetical protein